MLSAIVKLLSLTSFINDALKQTPLGPTVDLGCAPEPSKHSHMVNLGYATYRGNLNESYPNTVAYLGIPYAEPPVGDLRFRATVPLDTKRVAKEAKGQPVDATQYPVFCVQGSLHVNDGGGSGSEDCLTVNVYTPRKAKPGDKLPVLFYIHGGGWMIGNPENWPFEHWIEQSPNVVIVSIQYRLGSFGFLATPEFTNPAYGDFNAGFKDQREALRWVKSYISKFGGDPTKVTIAGHSAGGGAVQLHMTAKRDASQLFSQAIAQSVGRRPVPTPKQQQPLFKFYASHAGCGTGSLTQQMKCLRGASISALVEAQNAAGNVIANAGLLYRLFLPVLDGVLITGHPTPKFQRGDFTRVPLLIGSASNETLTPETANPTIPSALRRFFPLLTDKDIQQFLWQYPQNLFDSESQQFQVATGEPQVICADQSMGGPSSQHSITWNYRYNTPDPRAAPNVTHSAESWMMFRGRYTGPNGTFETVALNSAQRAFASELIAYWLSFVRTGNPNVYKLARSPEWRRYFKSNPIRMVLMQDLHDSTTESGSYMERQPAAENARCTVAIDMADVFQN